MRLIGWPHLTSRQKREVRAAFVNWKFDTTSRTFEQWAGKHAFYITKDGRLSRLHKHCEPIYLAD